MKCLTWGFIFGISGLLLSCGNDDEGPVSTVTYDGTTYSLEYGNFPPPQFRPGYELTEAGVDLGKRLFFDPLLSLDNSQSCASCHDQANAFTDTARFSVGVEGLEGRRQAMSVFNMAWNTNGFFWDGRAELLMHQVIMPIEDPLEMNVSLTEVLQRLQDSQDYPDLFTKAFRNGEISEENLALALEQFCNSIVSVNSKYDQSELGLVSLTAQEEEGKRLFFAEFNPGFPSESGADCAHCHGGFNFENDRYMNNGLDTDASFTDLGREEATGNEMDRARFKVPSLRNIALTAPYMHDGRFSTLREAVEHYNTGVQLSSTLDPTLIYPANNGGLQLSEADIDAIVAFLNTLTDYDLFENHEYEDPFGN